MSGVGWRVMADEPVHVDDDARFDRALAEHAELVARLASGDVHALDSLIEAAAGVEVVGSRTIAPAD